MGTRLYVGNLDPSTSSTDLRQALARAGQQVEQLSLVRDPITGRRRGFGFIDFPDERTAARAAEALAGLIVAGRELSIQTTPRRGRGRAE
jgi:RNA recognition motif-containing protein